LRHVLPGPFSFFKTKAAAAPGQRKAAAASKRHREKLLRSITLVAHGFSVQSFFEEPGMQSQLVKTPVAAEQLGIPYTTLIGLLRRKQVQTPEKDSSGDFVWSKEDLDRVRQVLAKRHQRKGVPA
jgi:hypothetical protein